MKLKLYLLTIVFLPLIAVSQYKSISLEQCRDSAMVNWPSFKKLALQKNNNNLIVNVLDKNYLPKLVLSGSATYQSEVVVFPEINLPGMDGFFPVFPKDNYRTDIQLQQIIYDGGSTKSLKKLQVTANLLEENKIEIENYNLMEQINELYLNVLLLRKNKNILLTAQKEIDENIKVLQSAYDNGAILVSAIDRVIAEKLKIKKQVLSAEASIGNLINSLQMLTGLNISTETTFIIPTNIALEKATLPQINLFSNQKIMNSSSLELEHRKRFPHLSFIANGGFGRPGYNFMDTDLHPYAMVGINLSWNIIDWGVYSKTKQKTVIRQNIVDINNNLFISQNNLEIKKLSDEISNIKKQIELDKKIILIKEKVKNESWSKFKNGTITSNEYLKDFNDYKIAEQTLEINKVKIVQKQINKNHLMGVLY